MDTVLLSIIVPAFNVEDYLQKCIDSIFLQKNQQDELDAKIEMILVDDGSIDRTGEICDLNAKSDSRIRVIHQDNRGVAAARNRGIKSAKGKWILFVDSDDWLNISVIKELLIKPGIEDYDMVGFSFEMERPNNKVIASSNTGDWYTYDVNLYRKLFQTLCLQNQMYWPNVTKDSYKYPVMTLCYNKLYKKDFLLCNNILLREGIAQHEDRIFNYECVNSLGKILFYDKVAYRYQYRPSSAVHMDGLKMINQMRSTLCCFYSVIGEKNREIIDGPFAYSSIQILWTIIDRLGNNCGSVRELSLRAKEMKQFMQEPVLKDVFKKVQMREVHSTKHKIICGFLKYNMTYLPILLCYIYHKLIRR